MGLGPQPKGPGRATQRLKSSRVLGSIRASGARTKKGTTFEPLGSFQTYLAGALAKLLKSRCVKRHVPVSRALPVDDEAGAPSTLAYLCVATELPFPPKWKLLESPI